MEVCKTCGKDTPGEDYFYVCFDCWKKEQGQKQMDDKYLVVEDCRKKLTFDQGKLDEIINLLKRILVELEYRNENR